MFPQLYWRYGDFVVAEHRNLPAIQVNLIVLMMYTLAYTTCIAGVLSTEAHSNGRPVIVPRATV